ncbi:hypothetical protein KCP75_12010 [Salmonella enterica subsp. enterica]|nr:hypothetical protein KCP75_12010 [Salmonella enterica subsp. enterica]
MPTHAGPTPVSALIHAATMVTAGSPPDRSYPWWYSFLMTLKFCIWWALSGGDYAGNGRFRRAQTDIKRVLAYSTMSL